MLGTQAEEACTSDVFAGSTGAHARTGAGAGAGAGIRPGARAHAFTLTKTQTGDAGGPVASDAQRALVRRG